VSQNKSATPTSLNRCSPPKQVWDTEIFMPESTNLSRESVEEGILEDIRYMLAEFGGIDDSYCREEIIEYFRNMQTHRFWWFASMRNFRRKKHEAENLRKAKLRSTGAS
jgi:hypothetical protein